MPLLTGDLYLDYDSDGEDAHYQAKVSGARIKDQNVTFDFEGHDPDSGWYKGRCNLARKGISMSGSCEFHSAGDKTTARIEAKYEKFSTYIQIEGTWMDEGEAEPYQMYVELHDG